MSDSEEYDFEYSEEEESEENENYLIENEYYAAKNLVEENQFAQALEGLDKIIQQDKDSNYASAEWGFKALKQSVKALLELNRYEELMERYQQLLQYVVENKVTRNFSEEAINQILDMVSLHASMPANLDMLTQVYHTTLSVLKGSTATDRLWFKTNLKLGYLYLETGNLDELRKVLKDLQRTFSRDKNDSEGELDDHRRGSQKLEMYALQIQLHTIEKDNKKLRSIYDKALLIKAAAIPHPKVHAIIRECGGKMHMKEKSWEKARTDFFEAFKNYDQAGDGRRISCLKYLVLANMLTGSKINPFEGQETKPYEGHPEITVMTSLVDAFLHNEVQTFEKVLKENKDSIMKDEFISMYITDLLNTIRGQVITKMIKPYTRISLHHISSELAIPIREVEDLLVSLILDEDVKGHIDQTKMTLLLEPARAVDTRKFLALQKYTQELERVGLSFE